MIILTLIASLFALLAVLLLFAWPVFVAAPKYRLEAIRSPEMRFLAGGAASVAIALLMAPFAATALISGTGAVQVFAENIDALSFGL